MIFENELTAAHYFDKVGLFLSHLLLMVCLILIYACEFKHADGLRNSYCDPISHYAMLINSVHSC
jgi:hypothetical protein